jgi:hypothetical protein
MHWVARQNKLELPNDEEEVNTRDIHKCDGQAHDPDTMEAPLTPKPTRKAEALAKAPPTITSRRTVDVALKEVAKPRLGYTNGILETKTKDGSTAAKAPPINPVLILRFYILFHFDVFKSLNPSVTVDRDRNRFRAGGHPILRRLCPLPLEVCCPPAAVVKAPRVHLL